MHVVNVPMRAALRPPFVTPLSGNLMLISYTGRKSGKAYRQPVSYLPDGDVLRHRFCIMRWRLVEQH
jgi:hypothetical protein